MGYVKMIVACVLLVLNHLLNGVEAAPSLQRSKRQGLPQGFPQHLRRFYQSQPALGNQQQSQYSQNAQQFVPQSSQLERLQTPARGFFDQIVQNINSGHRAKAKANPNYNPNIPTENPQDQVIAVPRPRSTESSFIGTNDQITAAPKIEPPQEISLTTASRSNLGIALFKRFNDDIEVTEKTDIVQNTSDSQVVAAFPDDEIRQDSAILQLQKIIEDQRRVNMEHQEKQLQQLEEAKAQLDRQIENQKQLELKWLNRIIEQDNKAAAEEVVNEYVDETLNANEIMLDEKDIEQTMLTNVKQLEKTRELKLAVIKEEKEHIKDQLNSNKEDQNQNSFEEDKIVINPEDSKLKALEQDNLNIKKKEEEKAKDIELQELEREEKIQNELRLKAEEKRKALELAEEKREEKETEEQRAKDLDVENQTIKAHDMIHDDMGQVEIVIENEENIENNDEIESTPEIETEDYSSGNIDQSTEMIGESMFDIIISDTDDETKIDSDGHREEDLDNRPEHIQRLDIPKQVNDAVQLVSKYFDTQTRNSLSAPEYVWKAVQNIQLYFNGYQNE